MNRSRSVLVALIALVGVTVALALVAARTHTSSPRPGTAGPPRPGTAGPQRDGVVVAVLRDWDARRAEAYAAGSTDLLADLYVPGAGAADLRLLRSYRDRGLRVEGMRTQLLSVAVLERRPDRWTLRVTDRLDGAVAVHDGQRTVLPRDGSSARLLTLVRSGGDAGRWRVARVVAVVR